MDGNRYLFFTNECVGLGHLRRALSLARAVTEADRSASALIVTGSPMASDYDLSDRIDVVTLPALSRDIEGNHRPRRLAIPCELAQDMRSAIALAVADSFAPDVAVVDKTPLGLGGELIPALDRLAAIGTRLVLGLRDIEDSPPRVERAWAGLRGEIEDRYDAAIVYGPASSPHALACLCWDVPFPVHTVGYVTQRPVRIPPADLASGYVVVTVGGGSDGVAILRTYLEAIRASPIGRRSLLVTGPLMPSEDVHQLRHAAAGTDADVITFRADMEAVVAGAVAVVAMAGYNSVAEIVQSGVPALLVPRCRPSCEQLVRAQGAVAAGTAAMLHPDDLSPRRLRDALETLLATPRRAPSAPPCGARRTAEILVTMCAAPVPA